MKFSRVIFLVMLVTVLLTLSPAESRIDTAKPDKCRLKAASAPKTESLQTVQDICIVPFDREHSDFYNFNSCFSD